MCINNIARHIVNNPANENGDNSESHITAFEASYILSIAFCKAKEEIIMDIVKANVGE